MSSRFISFEGGGYPSTYTDGGSFDYRFHTNNGELLLVFIQIPNMITGFIPVMDSSQTILLAQEESFNLNDTYSIQRHSKEEHQLLVLINESLIKIENDTELDQLLELVEIIETRNFGWYHVRPKHQLKRPKVHINHSSIQNEIENELK
ncbi:hypothetical protein P4B35_23555 [Pontiellaceae bacterium B12227]|nr:hypothetical protein [Pontiellaceae bacterium B12227]